jgi:hypothetical protein
LEKRVLKETCVRVAKSRLPKEYREKGNGKGYKQGAAPIKGRTDIRNSVYIRFFSDILQGNVKEKTAGELKDRSGNSSVTVVIRAEGVVDFEVSSLRLKRSFILRRKRVYR